MLSWMLMPSSVMLTVACGRPSKVVLRGPAGVCVPGSVTMRSVALRLGVGRSLTCLPVRLLDTVALVLSTTSAPPVTSTVSETAPTSSARFTVAGMPASSRTSDFVAVLKPGDFTVTLYVAVDSEGTAQCPLPSDKVLKSCPVSVFATVTTALGTTEPCASVMVPSSVLVLVWAKQQAANTAAAARRNRRVDTFSSGLP